MAEAYNTDVQNCMRLACLIINEGTACLRKLLLAQVGKLNQGDVATVLNQPAIRNKLKSQKHFSAAQQTLLYPNNGKVDVNAFDVTLLCNLLVTVCAIPHMKTCTEKDVSLPADICRIRNARNILYGHLTKMEMTDSKFEKEWQNIETVLVRLGTSPDSIKIWKTSDLCPENVEYFKKKIIALTESDLKDAKAIFHSVINMMEQHEDGFKCLEENIGGLHKKLESLQQEMNSDKTLDFDKSFEILKSLFNNMEVSLVEIIMKSVHTASSSVQFNMKEYFDELAEKQEKIRTLQSNMNKDLKSIKDNVDTIEKNTKALHQNNHSSVEDTHSYEEFATILKENKESYKLLLMNCPSSHFDGESVDIFCNAVGCVPWDIILDLDHSSRTEQGLHDKVTRTFKCNKDYIVCTYNNTKTIQDTTEERVAKSLCTLWLLANGCKDSGVEPCEKRFGKATTKIMTLLDSILSQLPSKKSILIVMMVLSSETLGAMSDLVHRVKETIEANDELIDCVKTKTLMFYMRPENRNCIKRTDDLFHYKQSEGTLRQIASLLQTSYSGTKEKQYYFPGVKGLCSLRSSEMVQMKGIIELYYTDIGEFKTDNMSLDEIADANDNIRFSYLKGNELTPQGLFINDNDQVFVTRREMKILLERIDQNLENRKSMKQVWPYILKHNAGGGGTTSARYVLYHLRKKYPCMIIQTINEKLYECVRTIQEQSKLPVLLVIDSNAYTSQDAISLQHTLSNDGIKALVVYLKRCTPGEEEEESHVDSYAIPSKIKYPEDKLAFHKLYQVNREKIKVNKVFLFGLLFFCEDYKRLSQHIDTCTEKSTPHQNTILQLICFLWKYAHIVTKEQLICRYITTENPMGSESVLDSIGYASDLIVIQDDGLRPAHSCIIEPVLKKLIGTDIALQLMSFVQILKGLIEIDSESKKESMNIMYPILLHRTGITHWSTFITDLEEACGKEYVLEVLQDLIKLNAKYNTSCLSHVQMLLARYLMYKMGQPDESILVMKKALKLKPLQSVTLSPTCDHILLNTYGFLLKERLKLRFARDKNLPKFDPQFFLYVAEEDVLEAVSAFKRAQGSTRNIRCSHLEMYDARSFIGEAKVRAQLLQFCFQLACGGDHKKFAMFTEDCDNPFIKESEQEAMEALQKMEILQSVNRLHMDDLQITFEHARRAKFDFLTLHFDDASLLQHVMKDLPDHVPCDIGSMIRGGSLSLLGYNKAVKRPWFELTQPELELIITTIMKRISFSNVLRCNYRDLIVAMIYIRQISGNKSEDEKLKKYSLEYALQCAAEWVKKYRDDVEALFMLGILKLVSGLQKQHLITVKDALDSLHLCQQLSLKYKTTFGYHKKKFAIGNGVGLEAVTPYFKEFKGKEKLAEFTGRQIGRMVHVRPFEAALQARVDLHSDESIHGAHQQPLLKFSLVASYSSIVAINPQVVEECGLQKS